MNYFLKLRFAIWTIVALSLIILVMLGTMFYFMLSNKAGKRENADSKRPPIEHFFQKELGFSPDQEKIANEYRKNYFQQMKPIFTALDQKRVAMIEELSKPNPDTLILNKLSDEFGTLHAQMKHETVKQLLRLRSICNPSQIEKLNILNKKLLGPEGHRKRPNPDNHKQK
jgi:hypothetical protein